jgi:hypothetical protein
MNDAPPHLRFGRKYQQNGGVEHQGVADSLQHEEHKLAANHGVSNILRTLIAAPC